MQSSSNSSDRANGLDTLRALAILLVFCFHYKIFVSDAPNLGWLSEAGWVGVDLFFVLSGYLIGNQVFSLWVKDRPVSIKAFYARRAFRTWPVFWVVLAAFFTFPEALGGREPPPLWRFLTFTQNYQLQPGTAFSHAWSLCIEEQFYAVFPLVAGVGFWLRPRLPRFSALAMSWALVASLIVLGVLARSYLWTLHGREADGGINGYYPWIYYATLCRFDEFMPGLAVAMLKNFHPAIWRRVEQSGVGFFVFGWAMVGLMAYGVLNHYYIEGYGYGFFMTAFGYSLVAIAFSLFVASALAPRSPWHWLRVPGAHSLALWSYSIYLIHKPLGFVIHRHAVAWSLTPWIELALVVGASLALGAAMYYLIELPFMRWRDRAFPSLVAR